MALSTSDVKALGSMETKTETVFDSNHHDLWNPPRLIDHREISRSPLTPARIN